MSTNNFCPSCGEPTTPGMKTCPNCGEILVDEKPAQIPGNDALKKAQAVLEETGSSKEGIQVGSRSNVVGDIMGRKIETQSMTENTNTHVEANTTNSISTSNVDNSQQVVNSNTNNVTYNIIYQNAGQGGSQLPNQEPGMPGFNPAQSPRVNPLPHAASNADNAKGIGAIAGGQGSQPKSGGNSNGNKKTAIAVCVGLVVAIGLFLMLRTSGETTISPQGTTPPKEVAGSPAIESPAVETVSPSSETVPEARTAPARTKKAATPAQKVTDSNYEKGMKAYQSREGLEAIKHFKLSGSAESNYMLGLIYEQGCGNVSANAMMARKYFKAAAQMGSEAAKAKL